MPLFPIINEGGLALGDDRLIPRLLLVGRDGERLAAVARTHNITDWTTDLDAALSDPACDDLLRCRGDPAARRRARQGARRRQARLFREAGRAHRRAGTTLCSEMPTRAAASTARSRTRSIFPDCRSSPRSPRRGELGRIVGFRLEFGWWVFDGSDRPCPAAELELPRGRRRADSRYVSALALRHRDDHRPHRSGRLGRMDRHARAHRRAGRTLSRRGRGFGHHHGRARGRCVRHHPELVGNAGAPRRPAYAAGRRHQGLGGRRAASMPRAVGGADAGDRAFQRDEGHRAPIIAANGSTLPRSPPIAIPTASGGNSSCAMSRPDAPLASDFAAGIRDVAFAEACHRSMTERTWIAFPPPGKVP